MQTLTAEKPKSFSRHVILNRGENKTWPTASVVALRIAKVKVERVLGNDGLLFVEAPFNKETLERALGHGNFMVVEPQANDSSASVAV